MDGPDTEDIFNSKDAILLSAMIYQAYQLYRVGTLVLPKGFKFLDSLRAPAGTEEPVVEVFGFIAESKDEVVIAIRGTASAQDYESDQDIFEVPYPFVPCAGKTHRGFTCIYQAMRDKLIRELNEISPRKRLLITGHSLGGPVAFMAALDFAVNTRFKHPIVYAYGSARPGDPDFACRYNEIVNSSLLIINVHDVTDDEPARAYPPPFTREGLYYKQVKTKYPISFQLNSMDLNHEISCYFKNLSHNNPGFTRKLCADNPGFCPDTGICFPIEGTCAQQATCAQEKSMQGR